MSRNDKPARFGPVWGELRMEFDKHGVKLSNSRLSDELAAYVKDSNLVPVLAKRARERQGRRLFF